jgi:lipid-A-disaccharide synthase-like uncharacterized protein
VKWEPWAVMALLLAIAVWLIYQGGGGLRRPPAAPGESLIEFNIAETRGWVKVRRDPTTSAATFQVILRDGRTSDPVDEPAFRRAWGDDLHARITGGRVSRVFRVLNVTSSAGVAWVIVGLAAQGTFAGRFLVQWIVSERSRRSVIPEAFWWLSLAGGAILFAYFIWRRDVVGVLGQCSGVVIYARNLRLIHKEKRRRARAAHSPPSPG